MVIPVYTLNIFTDIWDGIVNFFTSTADLLITIKDLISNLFDFIKTNIYLIPSPFSDIIVVALGVITAIIIIKIVGVIL